MAKKKKVHSRETLLAICDATVMYILLVAGVFISKYLKAYQAGEDVIFGKWQWGNFIVTLFIAFGQLTAFEQFGSQDYKGKRKVKVFIRRASAALSLGIAWHTVIGG